MSFDNAFVQAKTVSDSLPVVSVVIPMKNEERHIARCLKSIINQDYPRELIEVIVDKFMLKGSS